MPEPTAPVPDRAADAVPGQWLVPVRTLCEFTAKRGDLDLRFTPSPTAQEGIAGHQTVASRRSAGYRAEVSLEGQYRDGQGRILQVRGRADGYDPVARRIDEVKTHRGALQRQPENHRALHWAQARVYGHLLCQFEGLHEIEVALVYFDVGTQRETVLREMHSASALQAFFESLCARYIGWAQLEAAHRLRRDEALSRLSFPHARFRAGQRELAEAVYRAQVGARKLLIQAPTGIGKTIGTVFPVLKAMPAQAIDKLFYLTAKTPGRQLALESLERLGQGFEALPAQADGVPLRVIEILARDKACEHPDKACHGESCPLAQGFYDRLPQAREAMLSRFPMDREALREVASRHAICPYYLGSEMLRWADVAVGDYNHFFDLNAGWHGLTLAEGWRVSLLVDEAHNLIDRARQMYTCSLSQQAFKPFARQAPAGLKSAFQKVGTCWNALSRAQVQDYAVSAEPPEDLMMALQKLAASLSEWFSEHPTAVEPALQAVYFDLLHFLKLAELHGEHSLFDVTRLPEQAGKASFLPGRAGAGGRSRLSSICLRNVIPAPMLAPRWKAAHAAVLFSATLSPPQFQIDLLGLPEDCIFFEVPSPFAADQLQVQLARHLSTRYQHRQASLPALVQVMAQQYRQQPGNYLAFFSSFDYLQQAAEAFTQAHPDIVQWRQTRGMSEADRQDFIARFVPQGQGIGFAVLGGAFGEGIDLPGSRLIGAFIATLGLPQINPVNEQMRERLEQRLGQGYDYTYLFPGLQKVVQAAGRVIRTPQDRGAIVLLDERFGRPEIKRLLPQWWPLQQRVPA